MQAGTLAPNHAKDLRILPSPRYRSIQPFDRDTTDFAQMIFE